MLEVIASLSGVEAIIYSIAVFVMGCIAFAIYESVRYPEGRPPVDPAYYED